MDKRLIASVAAAVALALLVNLAVGSFLQEQTLSFRVKSRPMLAAKPVTKTVTISTTVVKPTTVTASAMTESAETAPQPQKPVSLKGLPSLGVNLLISLALAAAVFLVFRSKYV